MKLVNLTTAALCVLLGGCATTYDYNSYHNVPDNVPHATISSKRTVGLLSHQFAQIDMIDGKKAISNWGSTYNVAPGSHTIKVIMDMQSLSDSIGATMNLRWNAQAGQQYQLQMSVQGIRISGWVIDNRGRAVSDKVSTDYGPARAVAGDVVELGR